MLSLFLLTMSAFASTPVSTDLSGPVLSVEGSGIGMIDSCNAVVPGVRLGYRFDRPFDAEKPRGLAGVLRPEVGIRGLPCQGGTLFAGGRAGLRAGPAELGIYTHVGGTGLVSEISGFDAYPNLGLGLATSLVIRPVEVTVHAGAMYGYLGQPWGELGATVGVVF